jgi:type VI secretion system secreted protein Hcp
MHYGSRSLAIRHPAARFLAIVVALGAMAALVWYVGSGGLNPRAQAATTNAPLNQAVSTSANHGAVQFVVNGQVLEGEMPFIQIGGVDYSSDWNQLLSMSESISSGGTDGSIRTTSRATADPVIITKPVDKATPLLLQAMVQNQQVDVTIHLHRTNPDDGAMQHAMTYELDDARIVGRRVSRSTEFNQYVETLSIAYHTVRIIWEIDSVEFEWSVASTL